MKGFVEVSGLHHDSEVLGLEDDNRALSCRQVQI